LEKVTPIVNRATRSEFIDRAGPFAAKRRRFWLSSLLAFAPALLLLLLSISSFAQQAHSTESQVKAAYLYNFGKFVRWQGARAGVPRDSFVICVLGKDPFGTMLDSTVAGESVDGKKITVVRTLQIQETSICHVLFVSSSDEGRLGPILAAAQRFGIVTVSDMPRFAERGGMIGFVVIQNRIRFEVNLHAAELSRITLGSELIKVASSVIDKAGPGGQP
jgi:hypothetical protein